MKSGIDNVRTPYYSDDMSSLRYAYVIMTAMPPTRGHINLGKFAKQVGDDFEIILMTQPGEPFVFERAEALHEEFGSRVRHIDRTLPQDPETPGFWDLWKTILVDEIGIKPNDYIVASEPYGQQLARLTDSTFVPYDPYREITPCKATAVRDDPVTYFDRIAPTFQKYLRVNVTIFGAESTGKTTLAKALAAQYNGHFFMEWARPYLEMVGPDITIESMESIWKGQRALEAHSDDFYDKPFAFFDTDLYSTIGYWEQPHWAADLGPVPQGLIEDAIPSDLYLITQANIPFEEDPLRYGGDHRESSDEYWVKVAETYGLNYIVLQGSNFEHRLFEAEAILDRYAEDMKHKIYFNRGGF